MRTKIENEMEELIKKSQEIIDKEVEKISLTNTNTANDYMELVNSRKVIQEEKNKIRIYKITLNTNEINKELLEYKIKIDKIDEIIKM